MIQKFPYKQISLQKTASYFILKHLNDEHPFYKGAPRFELGTFRSAVECSTTELYPPYIYILPRISISPPFLLRVTDSEKSIDLF